MAWYDILGMILSNMLGHLVGHNWFVIFGHMLWHMLGHMLDARFLAKLGQICWTFCKYISRLMYLKNKKVLVPVWQKPCQFLACLAKLGMESHSRDLGMNSHSFLLHLNFGKGNQKEIPQCAFLGRLDKIRPRQWRSLEDIVMMPQKGVGAHPSLLGVAPAIYLLIAIATVWRVILSSKQIKLYNERVKNQDWMACPVVR